jgi:hypothetical protein
VGLTGVIYGVIVVGWAVFLVPLALRRHDQATRDHSIQRFSSAMRVLTRRRTEGGRVVVAPPRSDDRLVTPSLRPLEETEPAVRAPRPSRAALRAAAARRRRVLVVLVAMTAVVGAASAFGLLPIWSAAVPVTLIAAFLWIARRQVRLADERYWEEVVTARPEPTNVIRRSAARVDATHGASKDDDEPTVALTAAQMAELAAAIEEDRVDVVSIETSDGGSLWDPLPMTLPTYVDKPIARRTYRTIELDGPDTWSAGHSDADTATAAAGGADAEREGEAEVGESRAANA